MNESIVALIVGVVMGLIGYAINVFKGSNVGKKVMNKILSKMSVVQKAIHRQKAATVGELMAFITEADLFDDKLQYVDEIISKLCDIKSRIEKEKIKVQIVE